MVGRQGAARLPSTATVRNGYERPFLGAVEHAVDPTVTFPRLRLRPLPARVTPFGLIFRREAWTMKEGLCTLAIAGFAAMLAVSTPAHSQGKLKVLADSPLRPALIEIGEAFRRDGGQQVDFLFGPSPVILKKLADGEAGDVLIVQPDHIADLIKSGKVAPGEHPVIGRVGLGLAVRADAPAQSIGTVEAFRQVLLKADTLVFNTVVSGKQFAAILERLNIAEAVKAKVVRLPPGPRIYETVIQGNGNDVAAGVIPIIKETKGVRLLGPLPPEVQSYQSYAAAPMTAAASPAAAKRFIAFFASPAAKESFSASGVE
jgi:molybdate transport system substrate-binding protein